MARPLNRDQMLQNRAFLGELRRTGNIREAARAVGRKYSTMQHRRARHPAFARAWDAALVFAQARFEAAGRRGPMARAGDHRTVGGEPVVVRRNDGKLQMRRAQPGKLTRACEQTFLSALSATANVRLAAAAAGAAQAAFYRRRRRDPAFAREWRLALEEGYERLEQSLHEAGLAGSHEHDDWRHNERPATPPMTVDEALRLLRHHQKAALMLDEPPHLKRRRGESREVHDYRLAVMAEVRRQREREATDVAEAARRARGEMTLHEAWLSTATTVDLAQVDARRKQRRG